MESAKIILFLGIMPSHKRTECDFVKTTLTEKGFFECGRVKDVTETSGTSVMASEGIAEAMPMPGLCAMFMDADVERMPPFQFKYVMPENSAEKKVISFIKRYTNGKSKR